MTVIYYTSPPFLDISIEVINILKKHVNLHVLIEIKPSSKKANLVNVEKLPTGKALVTPEELLDPKDFQYLKPFLDGTASAHFIIHTDESGLSVTSIKTNVKVWRYIKKFKPDILHFETFSLRTVPLIPYLRHFKKLFLAIHDPVFHSGETSWKSWLPRSIFFRLPIKRYLMFYSDFSLGQFEENNKRIRLPRLVIRMFPYSYYTAFGKNEQATKRSILFFGRISPYKGIDVLLESVPYVVNRFPEAQFIIAGRSAREYKMNEAILNGYKNNITINNRYIPNEELASLIRNAKFVVCPYTDATQSGVLMTAYAFNAPVVATAVGAFPEYIDNHRTGVLVLNRTPDELAERIIEALGTYEKMSENIKEKYSKASWESNTKTILQAYNE